MDGSPKEQLAPKENTVVIHAKTERASRKARPNQDAVGYGADWGAVADGVSRSENPDRASKLAVETVGKFLAEILSDAKIDDAVDMMEAAFELRAHQAVGEMGGHTTLTAFKIINDNGNLFALVGSVGDSRAYKLSGGKLSQITKDDRLAGTKNVLTATIGGEMGGAHVRVVSLKPGDKLILATDGMFENVSSEDMIAIASGKGDSAKGLVDKAADNVAQGLPGIVDDDRTAMVVELQKSRDVLEQAVEVVRGYEGLTAKSGKVNNFDDYYSLLEDALGPGGTIIDSKGKERSMVQVKERIEELRGLSRSGVPIEQLIPGLNALTRTAGIRLTVLRLLSEDRKEGAG